MVELELNMLHRLMLRDVNNHQIQGRIIFAFPSEDEILMNDEQAGAEADGIIIPDESLSQQTNGINVNKILTQPCNSNHVAKSPTDKKKTEY